MSLPFYVDRPGEQAMRHPYDMRGVKVTAFALPVPASKLEELLRPYFETPTGGAAKVKAPISWVLVAFAVIDRASSTVPEEAAKGYVSEVDVAIWVPAEVTIGGTRNFGWFLPYVFVDSAMALTAGREIFGFRKTLGWFDPLDGGRTLRLSSLGWNRPDPDQSLQKLKLMEVRWDGARGVGPTGDLDTPRGDEPIPEDLRKFFQSLGADPEEQDPSRGAAFDIATYLYKKEVPFLFFKQFRDISAPDRACYQAITFAKARLPAMPKVKFRVEPAELEIWNRTSFPLLDDLGFTGVSVGDCRVLTLPFGIEAEFSFTMETGVELWSAASAPVTPSYTRDADSSPADDWATPNLVVEPWEDWTR